MSGRGGLARLAALATCLSVALSSGSAAAEYRHRVLLLEHASSSDADREIITRVRAELDSAGYEVVVLTATTDDPKEAVESAGRELHPASVLMVERLGAPDSDKLRSGGAELWLADRMLRKTVVLRLRNDDEESPTAAPPSSSREASRIAVQAVELVRARLAELAVTREQPPSTAPAVVPQVPPPPPPAAGVRPNLTFALGLLKGFQKGQESVTPVLRLGVALPEAWTDEVVGIDIRGNFVGLGRAARIEHGQGAATIRHTLAVLDAVVRFMPERRVQPFLALGGGFLALDVAGDAPEPYRNDSARTLSGLVTASAGTWLQPARGVGLVLEGQLLEAWSKTVVRIAGEEAGQVAAPLVLLSGGLMVGF
jgi:hypothetical protein